MMKARFLSVLFLLAFLSCDQGDGVVAKWPHTINYEVFVRSYADSDGDGMGDFNGLSSKLDYLEDLGIGGLWLMPIMESPSYHKYDVVNYKQVDPEYGSLDDFKHFVAEAHRHHIRIIIDLILNHTSSRHPWFQNATQGKENPYRDYYVWADPDSIASQIAKKEVTLDSDNITQWHAVGNDTLSEYYYGFFNGDMPDLNFDNPKVRDEFVDIGSFWLKEIGVDGFRLDAAKHIYPTDRATDNHAFWIWFRQAMQKIKPDVYLVGEVWSKAEEVAPYLKGLPALFNFDLGYAITSAVNAGKDTVGLVDTYQKINAYYSASTSDYMDAVFLKNHDQNRILTELGSDENKAKVAASILLTFPGTPYIYYGEEIGMKGAKPDEQIREPFLWNTDHLDAMQTSWEAPKYSTEETVTPLAIQLKDPGSMVNHYKLLTHYRNRSNALTYGTIDVPGFHVNEVVAFVRKLGNEKLLVLHNISDVEVTLHMADLMPEFKSIELAIGDGIDMHDGKLKIPAYCSVILK